YKAMDEKGLAILPFKVSNELLSDAMTYYIKRFHWVDASNHDLNTSIQELLDKTRNILGIKIEETAKEKERKDNKYFVYDDDFELERLSGQRSLLEKMTHSTYKSVYSRYEKPLVLDVGSNDGYLTHKIHQESNAR